MELLPCPLPACGGKAVDLSHGIACQKCGLWLGDGTDASAHGGYWHLWNRRPNSSALVDALRSYLRHLDHCRCLSAYYTECTCGLTQALSIHQGDQPRTEQGADDYFAGIFEPRHSANCPARMNATVDCICSEASHQGDQL